MYCAKCGNLMKDDEIVCIECGKKRSLSFKWNSKFILHALIYSFIAIGINILWALLLNSIFGTLQFLRVNLIDFLLASVNSSMRISRGINFGFVGDTAVTIDLRAVSIFWLIIPFISFRIAHIYKRKTSFASKSGNFITYLISAFIFATIITVLSSVDQKSVYFIDEAIFISSSYGSVATFLNAVFNIFIIQCIIGFFTHRKNLNDFVPAKWADGYNALYDFIKVLFVLSISLTIAIFACYFIEVRQVYEFFSSNEYVSNTGIIGLILGIVMFIKIFLYSLVGIFNVEYTPDLWFLSDFQSISNPFIYLKILVIIILVLFSALSARKINLASPKRFWAKSSIAAIGVGMFSLFIAYNSSFSITVSQISGEFMESLAHVLTYFNDSFMVNKTIKIGFNYPQAFFIPIIIFYMGCGLRFTFGRLKLIDTFGKFAEKFKPILYIITLLIFFIGLMTCINIIENDIKSILEVYFNIINEIISGMLSVLEFFRLFNFFGF